MEISILTKTELVRNEDGSLQSSVSDETPVYSNTASDVNIQFEQDSEWLDGFDKYTVVKTFKPKVYDSGDTFEVNDVVYKDHYIQKVTSIGANNVPQQPTDYTLPSPHDAPNNTTLYTQWDCYWAKIGTGISIPMDSYEFTTGGTDNTVHKLYRDSSGVSGWRYQITYDAEQTYYETDRYSASPKYMITINMATSIGTAYYNDIEVGSWSGNTLVGTVFIGTDGNIYKIGTLYEATSSTVIYKIAKQFTENVRLTVQGINAVNVYSSVDDASHLANHAYLYSAISDQDTKWFGRTFVLDGNGDLFIRTGYDVGEAERVDVADPQFEVVLTLADFPSGYFALTGVINALAPFDGENHTYFEENSNQNMSIDINEGAFDTVCLSNLIADTVTVNFRNSDLSSYYFINKFVDNRVDADDRLPSAPTTMIIYCLDENGDRVDMPKGSNVEVTLYGNYIKCGSIVAGLSTHAGFTNLEFNNEFKDWSPTEIDEFSGHVTYIEGVKQQIHNGTVDVPITNYDMMNRLMTSIGGKVVILNGSGSTTNSDTDATEGMFSSTMVIGRIKDFKLRTKIRNDDIDKDAEYSFTIEERT